MSSTEVREQKLVRGQVTSVVTKGEELWQIQVQPEGSEYTKNLWTKDAALVSDMSRNIHQWFDFMCNVSHWERQGKPVSSLWADTYAAYGTLAEPPQQMAGAAPGVMQPQGTPPPQPAPQSAPQQPPPAPVSIPQEVKELRIMRQTGMKVAALLLPYLPAEQANLSGLQTVSEWLVRYFMGGPQENPWQPRPAAPTDGSSASPPVPSYEDPGPEPRPVPDEPGGFPA